MFKKIKNFFNKCRETYGIIFEAYGKASSRETFKGELNYEAGKLFFTIFITVVAWLPYIKYDLELHQFPEFAISIRIGLTLLSIILIVLKTTKRFRNYPNIMMMLMIGYLNFGTALITATSGENAASYIGGFCFVLVLSTFASFHIKLKFIYTISSFILFLLFGLLTGLNFSDISIRYSINDLLSSFIVSLMLSYILNNIKYTSYQRKEKFMELVEQTIDLATKVGAASKAKSDFLAKMSHEIRTPMNAIIGMAELALRDKMSISAHEHILTIKQSSSNLLSIINDILDFSKIESGKMEIVSTDYQFSSLVNDVVSIIRMRVIDSMLSFVVNIDCNIPNALYGDEARIRQILLNVMSNAVKFTKKGFISFSASGKINGDTVILTIKVKDSGKGIKQEDIGKLFGDFVQVDLAGNKGIEGTGLGLAITKSLVNAMNGDISACSEYKNGSTFTITLPQKISSTKPLAYVENSKEINVLVYEHIEIYADSVICTIDNLGANCIRIKDDSELREKLKTKEYSFIFVSSFLLGNVKRIVEEFKSSIQIVLLTEFGDVTTDKSLSVLAMPVYSISVANILNGISDNFSYSANEKTVERFKAPSAKILVVDDISTNLKVAEGLMAPYEMQIDSCLSGAASIEAVKEKRYDLVFMDHMMPEMDGIEAVMRIRKLGSEDQHYLNLPIIALTANAVSGTKEMFLANSFNDFLSKPIDTNKLNAILEQWLPKGKQEKQKEQAAPIVEENNINIEINGVNIKNGIANTGGTLKFYIETLSMFHKDSRQKIGEIEKALETNNYHLFSIYVHALKSTSASIGANQLSEAAKALEMAGKQENGEFIKLNNPKFLADLETLLNDIKAVLLANNDGGQKVFADFDVLKTELGKLKTALETFDSVAIDEATNNLQKFNTTENMGSSVENILQNILIGEFDEAISNIDVLLNEMG